MDTARHLQSYCEIIVTHFPFGQTELHHEAGHLDYDGSVVVINPVRDDPLGGVGMQQKQDLGLQLCPYIVTGSLVTSSSGIIYLHAFQLLGQVLDMLRKRNHLGLT